MTGFDGDGQKDQGLLTDLMVFHQRLFQSGFLVLIQSGDLPALYVDPSRFNTLPSSPIAHAWRNTSAPFPPIALQVAMPCRVREPSAPPFRKNAEADVLEWRPLQRAGIAQSSSTVLIVHCGSSLGEER
jgi:hypothetical protein